MAESSDKPVIIDLESSNYAKSFAIGERIHVHELDSAINLIDSHIKEAIKYRSDLDISQTGPLIRRHGAIGIFGDRGTGKTSFVHTLFDEIKSRKGLLILDLIDPTIIEEKVHIFLLVISKINKLVTDKLMRVECTPGSEYWSKKREWHDCLKRMSIGLPSLSNVGAGYDNDVWDNNEFIMSKGMSIIDGAFDLERNFHNLVNLALRFLEKDAFVLAFDDTDTNIDKGWRVLETLRRYITTPQVITILSGSMTLYNLIVRGQQWHQFDDKLINDDNKDALGRIINRLENQYMLKIFKTTNRVHLLNIGTAIDQYHLQIKVKYNNDEEIDIKQAYGLALNNIGFPDGPSRQQYISYLLGLSIRSQISFLATNLQSAQFGIENIDIMLSSILSNNIDVDFIIGNPGFINISILTFLIEKKILRDAYLLLPVLESSDTNSCLTGLSMIFAGAQAKNRFLIFDYMLRIGFLRNLLLSEEDDKVAGRIVKFAGFNENVSAKNIMGRALAYIMGNMVKNTRRNAFINVYGLDFKAREDSSRIDKVLNNLSNAKMLIGYMAMCRVRNSGNNEGRVYFSLYMMLACFANLLRLDPSDRVALYDALNDAAQLRDYTLPSKGDMVATEAEPVTVFSIKDNDDSLSELCAAVQAWIAKGPEAIIPTYIIGRIATRLFAALPNNIGDNLADSMQYQVLAFVNSCLIEEYKELLITRRTDGDGGKTPSINYSNVATDPKILLNNLNAIKSELSHLPLTSWMLRCPLLWPFVKSDIRKQICDPDFYGTVDSFALYDSLTTIKIKENVNKPNFLYSRDTIQATYDILKAAEYPLDDLKTLSIKENLDKISGMNLFGSYLSENSVEKFIKKIKDKQLYPFNNVE